MQKGRQREEEEGLFPAKTFPGNQPWSSFVRWEAALGLFVRQAALEFERSACRAFPEVLVVFLQVVGVWRASHGE